jgi:hypothetical protein
VAPLDKAHHSEVGGAELRLCGGPAYAGHTGGGGDVGATSTYGRASLSEVAAALAALTSEPHPLATAERW